MTNYSMTDRREIHDALGNLRDKLLHHKSLKDLKFGEFCKDTRSRMCLAPLQADDPSFPLDAPMQRILQKLAHPTAQYSVLDPICGDESGYPRRAEILAALIADIDEARKNIQAGTY